MEALRPFRLRNVAEHSLRDASKEPDQAMKDVSLPDQGRWEVRINSIPRHTLSDSTIIFFATNLYAACMAF